MDLRRPVLLLALGLVAAFGAACGDEDDDDGETTAAATTAAATTAEEATSAADTTATAPEGGETAGADEATTGEEPLDEATDPAATDAPDDTARAETDTGAAPSPEQAAFIEQADAICQTAEDEISALGEPQSEAQLPEFISKAVEIQGEQIENLKGLQPPAGDEAFWQEVLGLLDDVHAVSIELREGAEAGQGEAELQAVIDRGDAINAQLDAKADEYGFQVCGS
jgi:hypothetical protein